SPRAAPRARSAPPPQPRGSERLRGLTRAAYAALATLPAFRQRVQTYTRRGVPLSSMRTRCRLGSNRRLVATIEWLRLLPNAGPREQTWLTSGMAGEYRGSWAGGKTRLL